MKTKNKRIKVKIGSGSVQELEIQGQLPKIGDYFLGRDSKNFAWNNYLVLDKRSTGLYILQLERE